MEKKARGLPRLHARFVINQTMKIVFLSCVVLFLPTAAFASAAKRGIEDVGKHQPVHSHVNFYKSNEIIPNRMTSAADTMDYSLSGTSMKFVVPAEGTPELPSEVVSLGASKSYLPMEFKPDTMDYSSSERIMRDRDPTDDLNSSNVSRLGSQYDYPTVFGVNSGYSIYKNTQDASAGWAKVPGGLKYASAGADWVWGTNTHDNIYRCKQPCSGSWHQVEGKLMQLDVGENEVWGVNSAHNIYKRPVDGTFLGSSEFFLFVASPSFSSPSFSFFLLMSLILDRSHVLLRTNRQRELATSPWRINTRQRWQSLCLGSECP